METPLSSPPLSFYVQRVLSCRPAIAPYAPGLFLLRWASPKCRLSKTSGDITATLHSRVTCTMILKFAILVASTSQATQGLAHSILSTTTILRGSFILTTMLPCMQTTQIRLLHMASVITKTSQDTSNVQTFMIPQIKYVNQATQVVMMCRTGKLFALFPSCHRSLSLWR